ncbi:phage minor head protein [Azospirillum melinis]|uniref:phage minor head protein n=1 Tax=Azospirillum melinis TaxID=328839 RepID=UPI0037577508
MADLLTDDPKDAEKTAQDYERELTAAILAALLLFRSRAATVTVWYFPASWWSDFALSMGGALAPVFDAHDAAARSLYRSFDSLDPAVVGTERDAKRAFLKRFGAGTKAAVDAVFAWGKRNGLTIEEVGKVLSFTAGTNARQTGGLLVTLEKLKALGAKEADISRVMREWATKALKDRAKMTAATELWNAVQMGRESAAKQAQRQSNEAVEVRKFWQVALDERLCPVCAAIPGMNPNGVPVGEAFRTPVGPVDAPTIHPRCRCTLTFETVSPGQF